MLWTEPSKLLPIELEQSRDEGKAIEPFKQRINTLINNKNLFPMAREKAAEAIFSEMQALPTTEAYPYEEPNDFQHIVTTTHTPSNAAIQRTKILGGLLGKCVGCLLGKPIEGWTRHKINTFLNDTNNHPIQQYTHPNTAKGMPEDDDINYVLIQFMLIKTHGVHFTSQQAAKLAWTDARISHVNNGIYGAMWVAAMIALTSDHTIGTTLLNNALKFTPNTSRFYQAIAQVLEWFDKKMNDADAIDRIHTLYSEKNIHHWCHVIPNAMIVTVALLWGNNDFNHTLHIAITAGFDTDCNAATVGSILGYTNGCDAIPRHWTLTLNDTIHASVVGMNTVCISELAQRAALLVKN